MRNKVIVVVLGLLGMFSKTLYASEALRNDASQDVSRKKASVSQPRPSQGKDLSKEEFQELMRFVKKVSKDQPLESSLLKHLAMYLADKILPSNL